MPEYLPNILHLHLAVKKGIEAEAERLAELLGGPLESSYDNVVFGG